MNNVYFEEYKRCNKLATTDGLSKGMANNYRELADSWWKKWLDSWTEEDATKVIEIMTMDKES